MRYYTYRRQVPLRPGDHVGFRRGKGYYRIPAPIIGVPQKPAVGMLSLQRTIFWATVTDDAVTYATSLRGWRHALTADQPYAPTRWQVDTLKAHSAGVDAWGVQTQIPPEQIEGFRKDWGLERLIQQAENPGEAVTVTAKYVIGNMTLGGLGGQFGVLNDRVKQGNLGATAEVYNGRPDTYDSNGFLISSFTLGAVVDGRRIAPLQKLIDLTPVGARTTLCIWDGNVILMDDQDRAALMTI
ncbi:MAG TPA: hypothetical protein VGF24_37255 [Vicinamibacterales bacterium]